MYFSSFFNENNIKELDRFHHLFIKSQFWQDYETKFPHINGLSTSEISTLRILAEKPDSMITEIGITLGVSKSTMTGIIDQLEKRGYIHRLINVKDRRSFSLELTYDGKSAQNEHIESEIYVYSHILSSLETAENVDNFIKLLELIWKNF